MLRLEVCCSRRLSGGHAQQGRTELGADELSLRNSSTSIDLLTAEEGSLP